MAIEIRKMIIDADLKDMVQLTEELGYPTTEEVFQKRMNQIEKDTNYQTFVAIVNGEVAGYLGLVQQYAWEMDGAFYRIQALVVKQQFRKNGIGKALIDYTESVAKNNNISLLLLNSGNRPERIDAHRFYMQAGFEVKSSGFRKVL